MSLLRLLVVAALPVLPLAAQRLGQPLGAEAFQKLLQQYDKNGDKKIARTEYLRTDAAWANLDRDGNGVLEAPDFEAPGSKPRPNDVIRERNGPAEKLPKVGDKAPDFELPMLGMKDKKVKLSSFAGKQPVALIFGSWT
ncbi:MAG: hypothetical protein Q7T30_02990 [Planctomycetota bacterium]|nr:hypothetical protein [Planctomycetota bacterium]